MSGGEHVGLVVLGNKYDGVDLPHDACRLLVLDGVPSPLDPGEQREAGALAGSDAFRIRKVQRLEQGMGRGIRDAEDHCAVILLGSAVALSLADPADLKHFSPATRAQIHLSQSLAAQIKSEGLGPVRDALTMFLKRDPVWKELSSRATAGVAYDPGRARLGGRRVPPQGMGSRGRRRPLRRCTDPARKVRHHLAGSAFLARA